MKDIVSEEHFMLATIRMPPMISAGVMASQGRTAWKLAVKADIKWGQIHLIYNLSS
jgi:hypothetical protein